MLRIEERSEKNKIKNCFDKTRKVLLPIEVIKTETVAIALLGCFQDARVECFVLVLKRKEKQLGREKNDKGSEFLYIVMSLPLATS